MNHYIGTKIVRAEPMTRQTYNDFRGWTLPADEDGADEGYLVEYLDGGKPNVPTHAGYVSWSPKAQFDNTYRVLGSLTFGMALEMLKKGRRVARAGWNGAGQFVFLMPAMSPYRAYLALKTAQGDIATWAPSCSDALAEDWTIVE